MPHFRLERFTLTRSTQPDTDIQDLTDDVAARLRQSGIAEGTCLVFVPGSTASISTIEYEPGCVADLKRAIATLAPSDAEYAHNERWGDGNGFSHVRAALLKPGISIPVAAGELCLGTWQQIVLLDFDNRPRERRIIVQCSGQGDRSD